MDKLKPCEFCDIDASGNHAGRCPVFLEAKCAELEKELGKANADCQRACTLLQEQEDETDSPRRRWEREVVETAKGWREWLLRTKQHDEFANDEGLLDAKLAEEPKP